MLHRAQWMIVAFALLANSCWAIAKDTKDSPAAAATRKKLKAKISVDYKEARLEEVMDDLKQKVKEATEMELSIQFDNAGGVSNNSKITFSAENLPVTDILDKMFKDNGLGYIVVSKEYKTYKGRYDGWLLIVKGKERGYPEGEGPAAAEEKKPASKEKAKGKEKPTSDKPAKAKEKPTTEKPTETTEDAADKQEREASRHLKYAKTFLVDGKKDKAIEKYKEIVKKYPKTKAAAEAKKALEDLEQ